MKKLIILLCLTLIVFSIVLCLILVNNKKDEKIIQDNGDVYQEENTNNIDSGDENMKKVNIKINGKTFTATLYNNIVADELFEKLPLNITMNELNGNEKYYYFDNNFTANSQRVEKINTGDIMLYGDNCLVIFYDDFATSYSYTKIGYIDNPENLKDVVGNSSMEVIIEK